MIDPLHSRIAIGCDACGRLWESGSNGWVEVWLQAKREGWQTRKIGKNWC